jgi:uncharacterized protein YjdB
MNKKAARFLAIALCVMLAGCEDLADLAHGQKPEITAVKSVSLNRKLTTIAIGGTETLSATVTPDDATDPSLRWESGAPAVATVSATGVITGKAAGSAVITVTAVSGGKSDNCAVTVSAGAVAVTGVILNKNSATLPIGGMETLTAAITPDNATKKNISWESSDERVATVNNGVISGRAAGNAVIIVTTLDGNWKATCAVNVDPAAVGVTGVTLNKPSAALSVGGMETLSPTISPSNATNQKVTWSSTAPEIADVSQAGLVTGVSVGSAAITVATDDGNKTASCAVTVTAPVIPEIPVTGVFLDRPSLSITVGIKETLTARVEPFNATNRSVTWSSSNSAVASVADGAVTGVAVGSAIITVTTNDGNRTAACSVSVGAAIIPVSSVTLNKASTSLLAGGTEILTHAVAPSDATNKGVSWSSNNNAVASVTDGIVIGKTLGSAVISVTSIDGGISANCLVSVSASDVPVESVFLNKISTNLSVGGSEILIAAVTPPGATNQKVTWESDEPAVAMVQNGLVLGVSAGTALITVTSDDDNYISASCAVNVSSAKVPVTGVTLNKASTCILVNGAEILTAALTPFNATNQSVTWSSGDTSVASVSSSGAVSALKAGTAVITVTTADGNKTAACAVTVSASQVPVSGVSLNKTSTSLLAGGMETLAVTVLPSNATNQNVTWESDDPYVAAVTNGVITGMNSGSALITVTAVNGGRTAACEVTVSASAVPVTGVSLNKTSISLDLGGSETLFASITPADATNQNLTWSSSNTAVASVTSNGVVTAKAAGSAAIAVTAADGGRKAECAVSVTTPYTAVTGVTLNKNSLSLNFGLTETLTAAVAPANATIKTVTWASSAPSVAAVSAAGLVTPVSAGGAVITVTTSDGNRTAACAVTVNPVSSATLAAYLAALPANTSSTPYNAALKVTGDEEFPAILAALEGAPGKYVKLDLTGSTVTSIPDGAFYSGRGGCDSLAGIIIHGGVTSIGSAAFYGAGNLASVTMPAGLAAIGSGAFQLCVSLTSVTIPSSVTTIYNNAFYYCASLRSVTFQGTMPSSGFDARNTFPGDLRSKYYASSSRGTPGAYTTGNPGANPSWTGPL